MALVYALINFVTVVAVLELVQDARLAVTSPVGVRRMPDFFTWIHPAGKNDSLALQLLLIPAFLLASTPRSTYAIARAAVPHGRERWTQADTSEAQA